jgi:hypothetical protein
VLVIDCNLFFDDLLCLLQEFSGNDDALGLGRLLVDN